VRNKTVECTRVKIVRTLEPLDRLPAQATISTRPSMPIARAGAQETTYVANDLELSGPLLPGRYALSLEVTCFQPDEGGILVPAGNPAKSLPICFHIPAWLPGEDQDVVPAEPFDCVAVGN
jgi:hypothetical protein